MEQYQVSFQGNRIDLVSGVDLYNYDFTGLPKRDIEMHKLARRSLSIITSSEYTEKSIPVWLDVCSGDRQDTEATITELKALLQPQNGSLEVLQSGETVEYIATLNEFNITWNATHAYVQIVFIASNPIGEAETTLTPVNISGSTTSTANDSFIVQGSALAEPLITIVVNAVTGGTGGSMTILNGTTNQGITISQDFVANDVIEIDSDRLRVTINGDLIDFTGLFPTFPPGSQRLNYSDTFTTRTVDIVMTYNPRLV